MYYHDLNSELRRRFGCKVYKLSLATGATCPNRDGRCGTGGCIFCDGAGFFAAKGASVEEQLAKAKARIRDKVPNGTRYIAYFQDYSATYAPLSRLETAFFSALADPEVVMLSAATRPDCLPEAVLELLSACQEQKPVMVELGLQTIHAHSAERIRRGYDLSVFEDAASQLRKRNLEVVVHLILGMPWETREEMLQSAAYVGRMDVQGVKLHLLHVLSGTDLGSEYLRNPFHLPDLEEYISLLEDVLRLIPPEVVIHRLTGDGAKKNLIAPLWSADKKHVLNAIRAAFERDNLVQGNGLHQAWCSKISP